MKVGKSKRVRRSYCLNCHEIMDGATRVGHGAPKPRPGNISICIYCGHIMAFDQNLALRNLNDEEMLAVAGDPTILAIQAARGMVIRK